MFAPRFAIRSAAQRVGATVAALVIVAGQNASVAQTPASRYPISGEQRQTAEQVASLGVPLSALAPNAPDTYTVKRGDTLWDISSLYLTSPWRWPELWGMNKVQVANPHLIYPGQTLKLVKVDGYARLEVAGGGQAGDVVRLSPTVRGTALDREAIPSIPNRVIEPFLVRPAVISPDELEKYPRIVATQEQRVYVGIGDIAYARGIADDRVERYNIFRPARPLFDPDDERRRTPLAYEAFYLGLGQITKGGEVATLQIRESTQEIGVGDRLIPVTRQPVLAYVPRRPDQAVDGRIISIYSGLAETGTQSVVTDAEPRRPAGHAGRLRARAARHRGDRARPYRDTERDHPAARRTHRRHVRLPRLRRDLLRAGAAGDASGAHRRSLHRARLSRVPHR